MGVMNPVASPSNLDHGGSGEDDRRGSVPVGLRGGWLYLFHPDPITRRVTVRFKWLALGSKAGKWPGRAP